MVLSVPEPQDGEWPKKEAVDDSPGAPPTTIEGWDLTAIECDDTDSTGDLGSATATFQVAAGETVKCSFTNLQEEVLGEIIDREPKPSKPEVEVLPRVMEPEVQPGILPFTGANPLAVSGLAALLMLPGAVVLFTTRRPEAVEQR